MKKTVAIGVPLVTILLLVELVSAKPIDHSVHPDIHDVITNSVAGLPGQEIDFTDPNYANSNTPDFTDTVALDNKNTISDLNADQSSQLTSRPVSGENGNVLTALKPDSERPGHLLTSLKPGPERPDTSITNLKPNSPASSNSITTSEPVSGGGGAGSSVPGLQPDSVEPVESVSTSKPGGISTIQNVGSGELGSSSTTLKYDSGRRENSATTSKPGFHDPGNDLSNQPVIGEQKNGASDIGSSCMMVLLGIFFIAGSQVK